MYPGLTGTETDMKYLLLGSAILTGIVIAGEPTQTEYRLTDRDHEIRMVLTFSTAEDCESARQIAKYFDHFATCSGG